MRRGSAAADPDLPGPIEARIPAPPLVLIFAVTVTGIMANTLINAPLPDLLDSLGQPRSSAGYFVAAGAAPGVVMAPVIGLLADRYGRRRVLVPCLAAFGVFGLAGAAAPTFGVLLVLRVGQGFGAAGLINLAVVLIGDYWTGIDRARIIGYNAAVLTVSLAVFPALGGVLAEIGGWRLAFVPFGFAVITAGAIFILLPADHAGRDGGPGLKGQLRDAGRVLRRPLVLTSIGYGFVLFVLIFGLFLTVLPILLADEFGLGPGQRGLIIAAPAIASTIAAVSLGRMRARFGSATLIVVASGFFAVAFATMGLAPAVGIVILGAVVYGFGEGTSIPTLQDIVAGAASDETRGTVVAVWVSAVRAGQVTGPLIAGAAMVAIAPASIFLLAAVIPAAGFVLLGLTGLGRNLDTDQEPAAARS